MATMVAATMAGCGQQPNAAQPATEAAVEQAESQPEETPETEAAAPEAEEIQDEIYASQFGWIVHYDPTVIEVQDNTDTAGEVSFVYTGESAGANMLVISMIDDKLPDEVISELKDVHENLTFEETVFPGTDDMLAYRIDTGESDDGSGYHEEYILGEYSNGTLCFEFITHKAGDDEIDIPVSDYLAMIIDSVEYENFGSQNQPSILDAETAALPEYNYPGPEAFYAVLYDYVVDELSKDYDPAMVTIPSVVEVAIDDSDRDDIKYYGDFWIYNYDLDGDSLIMQSGGNYPGVIHLKQTDDGYEATSIEIVADGSDFDDSAKELFGDRYDAFMKIYSDEKLQEEIRAQIIANYIAANDLSVSSYQDYGQEPVTLPAENIDTFYSDL